MRLQLGGPSLVGNCGILFDGGGGREHLGRAYLDPQECPVTKKMRSVAERIHISYGGGDWEHPG